MITSLRIHNFQSHEDTTIVFSHGVCVIVGSGDSGKTSILRAIRWNQSNRIRQDDRPMGDAFISRWAKKKSAKGTVTLTDDCRVTVCKPEGECIRFRDAARAKNDKESNGYLLNGERFEAIGVGVPDAVSRFFNWSEVNVQKQHDQAFLISKGAGEVASFLNRTVRLDTIDAHIQAASQLVRQEKDALKLLEAQQASDAKALDALAWVPGVVERMEALDAMDKALKALEARRESLCRSVEQWTAAERKSREQDAVIALEPRVYRLRRDHDWLRGIFEKAHKARDLVGKWETADTTIQRVSKLAAMDARAKSVRDTFDGLREAFQAQSDLGALAKRWTSDEAQVSRCSRLTDLEPRVQGLRALWAEEERIGEQALKLERIRYQWDRVAKALGEPVDWEDLEFRAKRLRALSRKLDTVSQERDYLRNWSLTFRGLETTITRSTEALAEMEAGRPETCPLCGGPMHKEHGV